MVFGVFLTQKKHRFSVFLVQLLENCFSVFTRQIHSFLVTHPLLAWGGVRKLAKFAVFFSSKDSKNAHFLTFFEQLHPPNNFKKQKTSPWGFAPNPTLTCEAAGAGGKPYPPTPTVSVGVDSKASRVKCTTSSPLTPLHLRGVAKLTEADGAGNLSRLAKQPRSVGLYRLEATNALW